MENMLILVLLAVFFIAAVICQVILYILRNFGNAFTCFKNSYDKEYLSNLQYTVDVLSIALLWYCISLSFTFFNKWLMQVWRGGFDFPIFITSIHLSIKLIISRLWSVSPSVEKIEPISLRTHFTIVFPIGFLIAADIILSNTAILYLPLSIVTTIKGSTLVFTFLWGVVIQIERFRWDLLIAVLGITGGLGVAVANSLSISGIGILCGFSAACAGGLRWALLQLLEFKDPQSKSVMCTLYRFTPASVLSILPLVVIFESRKLENSSFTKHNKDFKDALLLCIFGGFFAFCLVIVEVKLVRLTSALTMSVFGQVKEIIQISLAMAIFQENLSIKSAVGIGISVISSFYYRYCIVSNKGKELPIINLSSSLSAKYNKSQTRLDEMGKEQEMRLLSPSASMNNMEESIPRHV